MYDRHYKSFSWRDFGGDAISAGCRAVSHDNPPLLQHILLCCLQLCRSWDRCHCGGDGDMGRVIFEAHDITRKTHSKPCKLGQRRSLWWLFSRTISMFYYCYSGKTHTACLNGWLISLTHRQLKIDHHRLHQPTWPAVGIRARHDGAVDDARLCPA